MSEQLRDHDQPCEHDRTVPHHTKRDSWGYGIGPWCPGGREVTIDYEAAKREAETWEIHARGIPEIDLLMFRKMVDAALGIGETDE
jgi:hypothetical protein